MTFTDYYLRAPSETTLAAALPFARSEDGEWLTQGDGYALDLIGPLVTTPGTYDEDGNEITPPVIDNAFHANLRTWGNFSHVIDPALIVTPVSPRRIWA